MYTHTNDLDRVWTLGFWLQNFHSFYYPQAPNRMVGTLRSTLWEKLGLIWSCLLSKRRFERALEGFIKGIENRCALWIPRSRTSQQVIGKVFLTVKSFLRASICNLLERWWDSRPCHWASQMSDLLGRHVRQKAGRRDVRSSSPEVLKSFWVQDVYFGLSDKCLCLLGVRFHKQ